MNIAGVILAGGLARRMGGGDKALLPLGTGSLLDEVQTRLAAQVPEIVLNANGDPARFQQVRLPMVADSIEGFAGPLAGILAGMDWAAERGFSHVVSVAADTPFFPRNLVADLADGLSNGKGKIALAASREQGRLVRHPTFGLWPVDLREDLRASLGEGLRKVVLWTDRHGTSEVVFGDGENDPFFNVNRPEDLAEAQRRMTEGQT